MSFRILIVDDEKEFALSLAEYLGSFGYEIETVGDPGSREQRLGRPDFDLILLDIRMPGASGFDVLRGVKTRDWETPVIMISGFASVENIVKAMRFGALDFYEKPLDLKRLVAEIQRVSDAKQTRLSSQAGSKLITENSRMREVIRMTEKSADTAAPVLITGESGTGKELIANSLHQLSARRNKPFIKLNCAAIPDSLLESELFGYEAGAFTDAKRRKLGTFERADGGSIFFDELSEMSMSIQAKLLRVMQDGCFLRLGGDAAIRADVRIICATNRNLAAAVASRSFREDLYFRLAVITLEVPPLRDRREDILPLAEHFLRHYAAVYQREVTRLDDEVKRVFLAHEWVGNIRELKNAVERAVIFCEGDCLALEHLPSQYRIRPVQGASEFTDAFDNLSREMILDALKRAGGRKHVAAELLRVHRKTLYNRMKRLGIPG